MPYSIFQQDNDRPNVTRIVQAFIEEWGYHCSQTCMFARYGAHWTCLWYGWSATCISWSSNNHSWYFVDLHTNCMGRDSPRIYPDPLWFQAMTPSGMEDSHHTGILQLQSIYSFVILIICVLSCTKLVVYISFQSHVSFLLLHLSASVVSG